MQRAVFQRRLTELALLLPLVALAVFAATATVQADELPGEGTFCYYNDRKYSYGACADLNCCTWCWDDNQKCTAAIGVEDPFWSECGEGCE